MTNTTYNFSNWDEKVSSAVEGGPSIATAAITFVYDGMIKGEGTASLVMFYRTDGTGTFVGFEQLTGTVDGRPGSFVFSHDGTYDGSGIRDEITVVAGSGTGELAGLKGGGVAEAVAGQTDVPFAFESEIASG